MTDLTGRTFGRLIVVKFCGRNKFNNPLWLCRCCCGGEKVIARERLFAKLQPTRSCGCLQKEKARANKIHGMWKHPVYKVWTAMKQRCYKENHPEYKNYGGRGIQVCEMWRISFVNFLDDMGLPPERNLSLDRIDNNGNYCLENCRWATTKEQAKNKRKSIRIIYKGQEKLLMDWCEELKFDCELAYSRWKYGWSPEEIFSTPKQESMKGPITYNGKTQSIKDWCKETGLLYATLLYRLKSGWNVGKALTTPAKVYQNGR